MKNRLEQLDDLEEGSVKETLNLSQVEYLRKIEELNQNLISHWDNDQRVKALKIAIQVPREGGGGGVNLEILRENTPCGSLTAIHRCVLFQCSKLLIDTKVIQFYPSKFVLITDILDNFG